MKGLSEKQVPGVMVPVTIMPVQCLQKVGLAFETLVNWNQNILLNNNLGMVVKTDATVSVSFCFHSSKITFVNDYATWSALHIFIQLKIPFSEEMLIDTHMP